jgi:hypothetical protein
MVVLSSCAQTEGGLENRLANLRRGRTIPQTAHAGRGQEIKWKMSINMKIQHLHDSFPGAARAGAILLLATIFHAQAQYNYATLSVPTTSATEAFGISGTNIVGVYRIGGNDYSFLYNGSSYTTLSEPGADATYAYGISGSNIVGYYDDESYNAHGFIYNGSSYTYLNVPGAADTYACGISGTNIVGYYDYVNGGNCYGFIYNGSGYNTNVNVPGAVTTYARGISGNNIVGWYWDASYVAHGFLYNGSSYNTNVNVPGATFTEAYGISGNNIVGFYSDSSAMYARGLLATPVAPPWLLIAGAQQSAGWVSLHLTWTNNGGQCVLASAGAVTGGWSTVSSPWTTNSGWVSTVVTNSSPAQFYRLQAN